MKGRRRFRDNPPLNYTETRRAASRAIADVRARINGFNSPWMLLEAVAAEFRERPPRAMNERDAEDMKYARESLYKLAEMLWRDGVELRESERFSIFNR